MGGASSSATNPRSKWVPMPLGRKSWCHRAHRSKCSGHSGRYGGVATRLPRTVALFFALVFCYELPEPAFTAIDGLLHLAHCKETAYLNVCVGWRVSIVMFCSACSFQQVLAIAGRWAERKISNAKK